ncbi:hypothetical protein ADEAN_000047500 [Angomonas deanei]|uniref:Flagellar attachment zone protein 1 conserved domain-containing protein n=1 Tax=Angomonas deanei TaxID=59799 RepID=A0A7G2BZU4_9TRYP|nr:hypothetical protein ADEAN_000047500 [Angomonas deanei]
MKTDVNKAPAVQGTPENVYNGDGGEEEEGGFMYHFENAYCLTKSPVSLLAVFSVDSTPGQLVWRAFFALLLGILARRWNWMLYGFSPIGFEVMVLVVCTLRRGPWEFYLNRTLGGSGGQVSLLDIDFSTPAYVAVNTANPGNAPSEPFWKSRRSTSSSSTIVNSILYSNSWISFRIPNRINMHFSAYYSPFVFLLEMSVYFLIAFFLLDICVAQKLTLGLYFALTLLWIQRDVPFVVLSALLYGSVWVMDSGFFRLTQAGVLLENQRTLSQRLFTSYGFALAQTLFLTESHFCGNARASVAEFLLKTLPTYATLPREAVKTSEDTRYKESPVVVFVREFLIESVVQHGNFISVQFFSTIAVWFVLVMLTHGLQIPVTTVTLVVQMAANFFEGVFFSWKTQMEVPYHIIFALFFLVLQGVIAFCVMEDDQVMMLTFFCTNALWVFHAAMENRKFTSSVNVGVYFAMWVAMNVVELMWHFEYFDGSQYVSYNGGMDIEKRGLLYFLSQRFLLLLASTQCFLMFGTTAYMATKAAATEWADPASLKASEGSQRSKAAHSSRTQTTVKRTSNSTQNNNNPSGGKRVSNPAKPPASFSKGDNELTKENSDVLTKRTDSKAMSNPSSNGDIFSANDKLGKYERHTPEMSSENDLGETLVDQGLKEGTELPNADNSSSQEIAAEVQAEPVDEVVITSHIRIFEGKDWAIVLKKTESELRTVFTQEVESACKLPSGAVRNVEFSLGSLCVFFDVEHKESQSVDDIDKEVGQHAFTGLTQLYERHRPAEKQPVQVAKGQEKIMETKKKGKPADSQKTAEETESPTTEAPVLLTRMNKRQGKWRRKLQNGWKRPRKRRRRSRRPRHDRKRN